MVLQKSKEFLSLESSFGRSWSSFLFASSKQNLFLLVQCLKFSVLVEIFGIDVVNIENHVLSFLLV